MTVAHTARRMGLHPHAAFGLIVGLLLALVAGFTWATHEVYEGVTQGNGVGLLDHPALRTAINLRAPLLTSLAVGATTAAGRLGTPVLALLTVVALTIKRHDWTPVVLMLTGLAGSLALTVLGKNITGRVRPPRNLALPPYETSPSFPSGHTLNATVLATLAAYLVLISVASLWVRRFAVTMGVLFAVAVGLSRVYLGQHWLTDVIAGWLIGLAWGLSVVVAHRVWLELRGHDRPQIRHQ